MTRLCESAVFPVARKQLGRLSKADYLLFCMRIILNCAMYCNWCLLEDVFPMQVHYSFSFLCICSHSCALHLNQDLFQLVFDYRPGDIFGCVADIGWITGHSYVVYGPLMNGGTTVLFESTPVYPDPGKFP